MVMVLFIAAAALALYQGRARLTFGALESTTSNKL
jgi:hypothetical protein